MRQKQVLKRITKLLTCCVRNWKWTRRTSPKSSFSCPPASSRSAVTRSPCRASCATWPAYAWWSASNKYGYGTLESLRAQILTTIIFFHKARPIWLIKLCTRPNIFPYCTVKRLITYKICHIEIIYNNFHKVSLKQPKNIILISSFHTNNTLVLSQCICIHTLCSYIAVKTSTN